MENLDLQKDRLLTCAKVAKRLSRERTVSRLCADGELRAFRVKCSVRVFESSLREYMRRQIVKFERENGVPERNEMDRFGTDGNS